MTKTNISYSEAISEIEKIIAQIEKEELDVDELTNKVKRVATLLKICKDKLHATENEVEKILKEMDQEE